MIVIPIPDKHHDLDLVLMGIIMMLGIVVSNGVLLVDYTNVLAPPRSRSVHRCCHSISHQTPADSHDLARHRGGLIPMALGLGTGSETNAPLARAVVGGLTGLDDPDLFLVPTVYNAGRTVPASRADELGRHPADAELADNRSSKMRKKSASGVLASQRLTVPQEYDSPWGHWALTDRRRPQT